MVAQPFAQTENALLSGQTRVLELIATGASLNATLDELTRFIEAQEDGLRCGILIVSDDGQHFRRGAGLNLPETYHGALDGVPITPPYLGPCGQAAHTGAPVIVPDIANDTRWGDAWRELVLACGLRACRSTPVCAANGRVLASFVMYYDHPRDPHPAHPDLIDIATHLAGIALEGEHARQSREVLNALPAAVYTTDAAGRITYYNDAAAALAGRRPTLGSDEWCVTWRLYWPDGTPLPHDECPMAVALKENRAIHGAEACAERPDGSRVPFLAYPVPLRDTTGAVTGAVNTLVDVSEARRWEAALRTSEERYRTLFETAPIAMFVCDRNAVIQAYNRHAVELWGREPECGVEKHCGSVKLWLPDGTLLPHAQSPVVEVLRTGAPALDIEVVIERPDGTRLPVLVNFSALKDAAGEITGAITAFVDISERKRQEAEHVRLATIVEHSDDAIASKDLNGIIETWNPGAERLFGYPADEVIGKPINILIPADHDDEEPWILARIRSGRSVEQYDTVRRRKDGSLVDISLAVSPINDAAGRVIGASKIARDITARRADERHRELLLHELSHRVKNALATVQSVAMQTLASTPDLKAFEKVFLARIIALAHAHDLLLRSDWHGAVLGELIELELAPYRNGQQSQWSVEGKDIHLNPKAALALGMVFHELATNAAKYGALSKTAGCVDVTWQVKRDGALHLSWTERDGPRVKQPERRGFGSRLIENGLNYELGADVKLDYKPTGLRCTIDVALEAVAPTAGAMSRSELRHGG